MQPSTKIGIGVGGAVAEAGTAFSPVVYGDAVHNRNNDRNSLVNMALWFGTLGVAGGGAIAHFRSTAVAPWLLTAAGLGVAAGAGAKAAEFGLGEVRRRVLQLPDLQRAGCQEARCASGLHRGQSARWS